MTAERGEKNSGSEEGKISQVQASKIRKEKYKGK
jgi:hypothetical protein